MRLNKRVSVLVLISILFNLSFSSLHAAQWPETLSSQEIREKENTTLANLRWILGSNYVDENLFKNPKIDGMALFVLSQYVRESLEKKTQSVTIPEEATKAINALNALQDLRKDEVSSPHTFGNTLGTIWGCGSCDRNGCSIQTGLWITYYILFSVGWVASWGGLNNTPCDAWSEPDRYGDRSCLQHNPDAWRAYEIREGIAAAAGYLGPPALTLASASAITLYDKAARLCRRHVQGQKEGKLTECYQEAIQTLERKVGISVQSLIEAQCNGRSEVEFLDQV